MDYFFFLQWNNELGIDDPVQIDFSAGDDGYGNRFGPFDFVFSGGLTYPDVVSLNFTMTVDPREDRIFKVGIDQ